jgi:hypothetical protein
MPTTKAKNTGRSEVLKQIRRLAADRRTGSRANLSTSEVGQGSIDMNRLFVPTDAAGL